MLIEKRNVSLGTCKILKLRNTLLTSRLTVPGGKRNGRNKGIKAMVFFKFI